MLSSRPPDRNPPPSATLPLLRPLFWAAVAFAAVAALLPTQDAPSFSPSDKIEHVVAFFTLALLAALAYPGAAVIRIALALVAFGGAIELAQTIPVLQRDGNLADWLADAAAVAAGLILARLVRTRLAVFAR